MDSLYDTLKGTLSYAGDALDKPGRAVRGVLAGKPREAMAAIPFSDSMGLTDHKDSTSGRDLTDHYNLTKKGDDSFGSHAIGFGAGLLTDPLNLAAGVGAFKAAPTVAKGFKAGAKALSGLDLIDTIGGAASSAAKGARSMVSGRPRPLPMAMPDDLSHLDDFYGKKPTRPLPAPAPVEFSRIEPVASRPAAPSPVATQRDPTLWTPHGMEQYHANLMTRPGRQEEPWWQASRIANAEGIDITPVHSADWKRQGNHPAILATYEPIDHAIQLNTDMNFHGFAGLPGGNPWLDAADQRLMNQRMFETKSFSSPHANQTIDHELGHAFHRDSLGLNRFQMLRSAGLSPFETKAASRVSGYAASDPMEFVAEAYSGLKGGQDYRDTPAVAKLMKDLAGTPMLDRMSQYGLLKGLGLGVVGAAGLGAAAAASPTQPVSATY